MREDCFGYNKERGKCSVLTQMECAGDGHCSFYATRAERDVAREKSRQRLERLGLPTDKYRQEGLLQ